MFQQWFWAHDLPQPCVRGPEGRHISGKVYVFFRSCVFQRRPPESLVWLRPNGPHVSEGHSQRISGFPLVPGEDGVRMGDWSEGHGGRRKGGPLPTRHRNSAPGQRGKGPRHSLYEDMVKELGDSPLRYPS